ncbi:hypothetical protein Ae168Ps1_2834 [Pseudonocardia sp. Ae168_Ps1]|nr:hypothetical protein Ae150APs1_2826 [Pseudonocardia sp. Ae150A_Ps1]OLL80428.1 hypothetical protein Ae168Ps1_2834 [Pseudonocardia sp. Ae168_Ps1]OLL85445.1 hypothetical protein Ae263Ps1_2500c [Pseudonocardia sp. Ae263_Ps1]OLL94528.1 hypothetical protein Ae356Ps1_4425 [Pseudonocardia sp. Ae356_Ps1]
MGLTRRPAEMRLSVVGRSPPDAGPHLGADRPDPYGVPGAAARPGPVGGHRMRRRGQIGVKSM